VNTRSSPPDLISLLNDALARELQVSVQYMLQHAIGAGATATAARGTPAARRAKFVASHSMYWLPGATLKKVAIAEMRHAEAIAERIVQLGGAPTTQPAPITIGDTVEDMLGIDREQERSAIVLYQRIIEAAAGAADEATRSMFQRILKDEETHHRLFTEQLGEG